jgi:four helix bundle protein
MNDPEATMSKAHTNTNLIALDEALEAASAAITLVARVPAPLKSVADQAIRSASSVPANLAEGYGRAGRDRTHLWRISYSSAKEVDSHLRLLAEAGVVSRAKAEKALATFDEVRAMTWRLLNPRTRHTAFTSLRYHSPMPEDRLSSPGEAERLTAFHEAGHAVMAELCGRLLTEVEILGDREHTGSVQSRAFPPNKEGETEDVERHLKIILAGTIAEMMVSGREDWDEASEDLDAAVRLGMRLVDDCEDVLPLLEDIRIDVEADLRRNWSAVETLAGELLDRKKLTGSETRKLVTPLLVR